MADKMQPIKHLIYEEIVESKLSYPDGPVEINTNYVYNSTMEIWEKRTVIK